MIIFTYLDCCLYTALVQFIHTINVNLAFWKLTKKRYIMEKKEDILELFGISLLWRYPMYS